MDLENGVAYMLDGEEYIYTQLRGGERMSDEDGALYPVNGDGEPAYLVKGVRIVYPDSGVWCAYVDDLTPSH